MGRSRRFLTRDAYFRPVPAIRGAMKIYGGAELLGRPYLLSSLRHGRRHDNMQTLFWIIMGGIWLYDLRVGHASLDLTGRHSRFALPPSRDAAVKFLASFALGRSLPAIVSPDAVFQSHFSPSV